MLKKLSTSLAGLLLAISVIGALPPTQVAAAPTPPSAVPDPSSFDAQIAAGTVKPPKPTKDDKPTVGMTGLKGNPGSTANKSSGLASLLSGPYYWYNLGQQGFSSGTLPAGAYASMTIAQPVVSAGDYHSLAEIAVTKTISGQKNIVEIGWNVDSSLYGDNNPHLFAFYWVNGVAQCYNGCGFVDYAPNATNLGATLTAGASLKTFGIQYDAGSGGNWWLAYNGQWVGYYPSSLWTGAGVSGYTNGDLIQYFGEVASSSNVSTCTDMGNALHGTNASAALFSSATYVGLPTSSVNLTVSEQTPVGSYAGYTESALSARTFRYGGPGC